jgi:hypothetical protein
MAKVAENQKLWTSIMRQAKSKYPPRSPMATTSFAANKWASEEYSRQGGQWVSSKSEVPTKFRDLKTEEQKKKKAKIAKVKRDKKNEGLV